LTSYHSHQVSSKSDLTSCKKKQFKYKLTDDERRLALLSVLLNTFSHKTLVFKPETEQLSLWTSMTDAGTFMLTTSKHLATDHRTRRTITITTLTHRQLCNLSRLSCNSFQAS